MVWPAVIAAAGALAGGLMSKRAAAKNTAMQREFAQQGVTWKADDARRAGIHPIFAMGAQTHSFAPTYVGDSGLSAAGQDVSRAMYASQSDRERRDSEATSFMLNQVRASDARVQMRQAEALLPLQIQRAELENELLRSQIARARAQTGPGLPVSGGSLSGAGASVIPPLTVIESARIPSRNQMDSSRTAGVSPMWSEVEMWPGYNVLMPSKEAAEQLEGTGEIGQALFGGAATLARNIPHTLKQYAEWARKQQAGYLAWLRGGPRRDRVRGGW